MEAQVAEIKENRDVLLKTASSIQSMADEQVF
jgi:hypothetical protein